LLEAGDRMADLLHRGPLPTDPAWTGWCQDSIDAVKKWWAIRRG
jgi:hypothetical protein